MKIIVDCNKFNYGGNSFKKGDTFEVSDESGNLLVTRYIDLNKVESEKIVKKSSVKPSKAKDKPKAKDVLPEGIVARIKDFAEDLMDDGKRNRSNRKPKSKKNKK